MEQPNNMPNIINTPNIGPEKDNNKAKKVSTTTKVAVLIVLVALLIGGILLPIKIVPETISSLANTFSSIFIPKEHASLSLSKTTISSGEAFALSWNGNTRTDGSYSLTYECAPSLNIQISVDNNPYQTIPCNAAYYFMPKSNTVMVTASSTAVNHTDINLTLGFLKEGASSVTELANTTITVTNNLASGTTITATSTAENKSQNNKVAVASKKTSSYNPNGLADLEVKILGTGYTTSAGIFVPGTIVPAGAEAAVKFQIMNVGNNYTGAWSFSADLPSDDQPRFDSVPQKNLGPGDRIEYVLGFNKTRSNNNLTATIIADPLNLIKEGSKANNTTRVLFLGGQPSSTVANINTQTANVVQNGLPDLFVKILGTGLISTSSNAFQDASSVSYNDIAAIRFEVQNIGASYSGTWNFKANLPATSYVDQTYTSPTEATLAPGAMAYFTISFSNTQNVGTNTASIVIDPDNKLVETSKINNSASTTIIRSQ